MISSRFLSFQPDWEFSRRLKGIKTALRQATPGLDTLSAPAEKKASGRKEKCVVFVGPINPKSVTYVSERLLPISPVQTVGGGWGEGEILDNLMIFKIIFH